jgi:SAM-dependent methyltransferase
METQTQYDAIAGGYKQLIDTLPERRLLGYNLELHEGDVAAQAVLDLACGSGDYTRRYKIRGAKRVVGMDISQRMIDLALRAEAETPLGIEYLTGDVSDPATLGEFDLATAFGLLHYAPTREKLQGMCRNVYENLRPGGRFVTANKNIVEPELWWSDPPAWQKFNVRPGIPDRRPPQEGDRMTTHIEWGGAHVQFDNYFFYPATYEDALRSAGFTSIAWHRLVLPPEFEHDHGGRAVWQYLIDHPYMVILEARK